VALEKVCFAPKRVAIGGAVDVTFVLRSTTNRTQSLLVDLAVHFVKASGGASPKIFKLKRVTLAPQGEAEFKSRISLAVHTTRKPHPGIHAVDVVVNGQALHAGRFEVR
jgi:hypothetical protein